MTSISAVHRTAGVLRRMTSRGRDEEHRAPTPPELFFGLTRPTRVPLGPVPVGAEDDKGLEDVRGTE